MTENSNFICGLDQAIQNTLVQTTMLKFTAELLEWLLLTQEKTGDSLKLLLCKKEL